jgi:hypothetical protein
MNLVIVIECSTTILKMLDPVAACILNFGGKALLYSTVFYVSRKSSGSRLATDVSLESSRHKSHTSIR